MVASVAAEEPKAAAAVAANAGSVVAAAMRVAAAARASSCSAPCVSPSHRTIEHTRHARSRSIRRSYRSSAGVPRRTRLRIRRASGSRRHPSPYQYPWQGRAVLAFGGRALAPRWRRRSQWLHHGYGATQLDIFEITKEKRKRRERNPLLCTLTPAISSPALARSSRTLEESKSATCRVSTMLQSFTNGSCEDNGDEPCR